MALLEIEKIKRNINILFQNVRCLMAKSDENCPLVATEWSNTYSYLAGTYVYYEGYVYKCLVTSLGNLPTNSTYWLDLGEGHLLAEQQGDWKATSGRSFILNKPTKTSNFINDGEDGTSPFVTRNQMNSALPSTPTLEEVLEQGSEAPTNTAYVKEIGLFDSLIAPFAYLKFYAKGAKVYLKNKLDNDIFSIGETGWTFIKNPFSFNFTFSTLTTNRTATFQDKSGVVAYLSDIQALEPQETIYEVEGGTDGTQPIFNGKPLFLGSYIKTGKLVHFQIQVDMDNITDFGTEQYYMTLPYPAKYGYMFRQGCLHDKSEGREYHISGHVNAGTNQMFLYTSDTQGNTLYDFKFTATKPITLTPADTFHISGTYITD